MKTQILTRISIMSAIICIFAPISIPIPISPVPITLGTFALYISIYVLNTKEALTSTLLYLLLGAVGLPVFSGYTGGFNSFFSVGGGYLIGYIFLVFIGSIFVNKYTNPVIQILGMFIGTIVTYLIGTFWLSHILEISFIETIPAGVLVYLPLDTIKMILACFIGRKIKASIYR